MVINAGFVSQAYPENARWGGHQVTHEFLYNLECPVPLLGKRRRQPLFKIWWGEGPGGPSLPLRYSPSWASHQGWLVLPTAADLQYPQVPFLLTLFWPQLGSCVFPQG